MKHEYCPSCKEKLSHDKEKDFCTNCDFIHYIDVVACVSALPVKNGKVLLSVRKFDPYKGELDQLGGFMIPTDDSTEQTAIREVKEETGLDIKIVKLLGMYKDKYGEGGINTLNIQYIVEITGGIEAPKDDISTLKWVEIKEIPNLKLNGFNNTKETLMDLYKLHR